MPVYRVTRQFIGYEQATIEAENEDAVLQIIDESWNDLENLEVVDSYNFTGEDEIEEL